MGEVNIREGDVFNFRWKDGVCKKKEPYWCFDGQLVTKKKNGELILEDTYWTSNGRSFTSEEAIEKGELIFKCNLNDVEPTRKDCNKYFNEEDIFDVSTQHGCREAWVVRKGAKRSRTVMLETIKSQAEEAHYKISSAKRELERLEEKEGKIRAGDLTIYL